MRCFYIHILKPGTGICLLEVQKHRRQMTKRLKPHHECCCCHAASHAVSDSTSAVISSTCFKKYCDKNLCYADIAQGLMDVQLLRDMFVQIQNCTEDIDTELTHDTSD